MRYDVNKNSHPFLFLMLESWLENKHHVSDVTRERKALKARNFHLVWSSEFSLLTDGIEDG